MSTAAKFGFARPFPFCVTDLSAYFSGSVFDYIGNATLEEVMRFYWNVETFNITTAGTATNGITISAAGNVKLNPIGDTSPFDQGSSEGAWFGQVLGQAFGSFPAFNEPRNRVCNAYDPTHGWVGYLQGEQSTALGNAFTVEFAISTDPSNPGRYRLYYHIDIDYSDAGSPILRFQNPASNLGRVLASGTFTITGFVMNWQCSDYGTSRLAAGLSLSATSGDYSY